MTKIALIKKILLKSFVITALIYSAFILIKLYQYDWNPSGFIHLGDYYGDQSEILPNIQISSNAIGYDGQFYYRMALDPFSLKITDYGITFDYARYRYQRILYPLISWGLSFGNKALVPVNLILVNLLFLIFMAHIGGKLADNAGYPEWYGIILPLYSGFFMTLTHDLTEIIEITLMLFSFYLVIRGRDFWAAILVTLSILAKETALLAAFGYLVVFIWRRKRNWFYFLLPFLVYFLWQLFLNQLWESQLKYAVGLNISFPFLGIIRNLLSAVKLSDFKDYCFLIDLSILIIFIVLVIRSFLKSFTPLWIKVSWLLYGMLVICASEYVWVVNIHYLRVLSEFFILGLLILLGENNQKNRSILAVAGFIWIPFALFLLLIIR